MVGTIVFSVGRGHGCSRLFVNYAHGVAIWNACWEANWPPVCRALTENVLWLLGGLMRWADIFGTSMELATNIVCVGRSVRDPAQVKTIQNRKASTLEDSVPKWILSIGHLGIGSPVQICCNLLPFSGDTWLSQCRIVSRQVTEWFMIFFLIHKVTMGFAVIGVINGALAAAWESEMNSRNSACELSRKLAGPSCINLFEPRSLQD